MAVLKNEQEITAKDLVEEFKFSLATANRRIKEVRLAYAVPAKRKITLREYKKFYNLQD